MICFPNAKINIGLTNLGIRDDGYHNIRSTIYPIPIHDCLEIVRCGDSAEKCELTVSGIEIDNRDNLCIRAYELIDNDFHLKSVRMHLHKLIPIGAGLGGGSSDAANTILMLNGLFKLQLSTQKMKDYAATLGSDCPFFIDNIPSIVTGKGDELGKTELNLHEYSLIIIYPDIHINTSDAYTNIQLSNKPKDVDPSSENVQDWRDCIFNDFEKYVFASYPQIGEIKAALYERGAVYASLSGSGSSVYGVFNEPIDLKSDFKNYNVWCLPACQKEINAI